MASDFDISQAAAAVYAESLLQLANEAGRAEDIASQLSDAKALWERESAFASLMSSEAIDREARRRSIDKVFGEGRIDKLILHLLLVLNAKRRTMIFPLVCDAFRRKLDAQLGREQVHVTTATPLSDGQRERLLAEVRRLTSHQGILVEKIVPEMLGGMTVLVADKLYDMTILHRLKNMRAGLLASSGSHLRDGVARFVTEG
jgi:F-type H+-transporting ATPase subunit delta